MVIAGKGMKGAFCKDCPAGGADEGCTKLTYRPRTESPDQWIEGDPRSPIWIIGLNPKTTQDPDTDLDMNLSALRDGFKKRAHDVPYFRYLKRVSEPLFNALGSNLGVAHTDIVKCDSTEWPPAGISTSNIDRIEETCAMYLDQQIREYKPKLLICNGSPVCRYIKRLFDQPDESNGELVTHFESKKYGESVHVILSGFIGRIDSYAKRRLGREIEQRIEALGISLTL